MISYKELRIDNLVTRNDMDGIFSIRALCKDQVHPISLIDHDFEKNAHFACECTLSELEPIPLTAEWLLKFGFINKGTHDCGAESWRRPDFEFGIDSGSLYFYDDNYCVYFGDAKYVHQLQNIYFLVTGEELTIKETV